MGIEPRPYMFLDGEQQLKMAEPAELRALGKLGTEDAERVSANNLQKSVSKLLEDVLYCVYSFQFVHGVISEMCGKQGVQYEDFAKLLTLGEYSSLSRHLPSTAWSLAREGLKKQEVGTVRGRSRSECAF